MNYKSDGNFHTDLIELLAKRMRPAVYVELGLGPDAATILRVARYCGLAIGCDLVAPHDSVAVGEHFPFDFCMVSSSEFIEKTLPSLPPIELAFIDGDHSAQASFNDFTGILPYMAADGIILMHDTYPESEAFTDPGLCGDCWKTAEYIRGYSGIEVVTLPCPPGLTIIRKLPKKQRWIADQ